MNYILIQLYDSVGASIATDISQLVVCIAQLYVIRKDISVKEILKDTYKHIISGLIMFWICILIKHLLGTSLKVMLLQIAVGMVSYAVCLLLLKDKYFKELLFRIKLILESKLKR